MIKLIVFSIAVSEQNRNALEVAVNQAIKAHGGITDQPEAVHLSAQPATRAQPATSTGDGRRTKREVNKARSEKMKHYWAGERAKKAGKKK